MSSGEVGFCCQISYKNPVCRAFWSLEMQVRVREFVVPVSLVGLTCPFTFTFLLQWSQNKMGGVQNLGGSILWYRGKAQRKALGLALQFLPTPFGPATERYVSLEDESELRCRRQKSPQPLLELFLHALKHTHRNFLLRRPNGGC